MSEDDAYQLGYATTSLIIKGLCCLAVVGGAAWLIYLPLRSTVLRRRQTAADPST